MYVLIKLICGYICESNVYFMHYKYINQYLLNAYMYEIIKFLCKLSLRECWYLGEKK